MILCHLSAMFFLKKYSSLGTIGCDLSTTIHKINMFSMHDLLYSLWSRNVNKYSLVSLQIAVFTRKHACVLKKPWRKHVVSYRLYKPTSSAT